MLRDARLIGIDPGPKASGVVLYDGQTREVLEAHKAMDLDDLRQFVRMNPAAVVCERTQAGPPSTQVVLTTEVVGRVQELCHWMQRPLYLYYRRDVLQALNCAKQGNKDSLVRQACIELHGGDPKVARGTKKAPGRLYGVSSHAWQALGLVMAHRLTMQHKG